MKHEMLVRIFDCISDSASSQIISAYELIIEQNIK